jgi:hypothetical protein
MGLLDLFLQNQSLLDIEQVPQPGNGPIGTPTGEFNTGTTPFQQIWDSNNTYINSFIGGTNTGIQPPTLTETGLDVDDPTFVPSTTLPSTLTNYPATARGSLGLNALQFIQIWNPIINYNDVVVGSSASPLEQTLSQTSLDNTDSQTISTTPTPSSVSNPTNYPLLVSGEFNGAPSQYSTPYNSNNTYLNSITDINNTPQVSTLSQTGLDNTDGESSLTSTTPNSVSYPTNYPSLTSGEFNGAPSQYDTPYNSNNTYLNSIIDINNTPQVNTLDQTGLDNTDDGFAPTTIVPSVLTQYPQFTQGKFNGSPTQFNQIWNFNNKYIINYNPDIQPDTLSLTGLDSTNNDAAPTTVTPNTITQYPSIATGKFGGASNQYTQIWNPDNTYDDNYNPDTQPDTLDQTGLDTFDPTSAPTTTIPTDETIYPSPSQTYLGKFRGAPSPFVTLYTSNQTYLDNYDSIINNSSNVQVNTLNKTGLDNENALAEPTTYIVPPTDTVTVYPSSNVTGITGSAPQPYTQEWTPSNSYYEFMKENYDVR